MNSNLEIKGMVGILGFCTYKTLECPAQGGEQASRSGFVCSLRFPFRFNEQLPRVAFKRLAELPQRVECYLRDVVPVEARRRGRLEPRPLLQLVGRLDAAALGDLADSDL
jgi:hypothetical protein